ncbi:MAG: glutamate 5-kinase [Chlamydiota bacterium]
MKHKKRIVIKFGTTSITNQTECLSRPNILEFVRQIAQLHAEEVDLIIVSSGAVAAGREVLQQPKISKELPSKQMFSSVGQSRLVQLWGSMFAYYGIDVGQILLTRADLKNRHRYLNIRDTLEALLSHRVIPVINENDSVATEEIRVGDNDNLSARVANLLGADLLILLTDQQGLYDRDPRKDSDAVLINTVEHIDETLIQIASGGSDLGTGGMVTKIEAAQIATQSGTPTVIAMFSEKDVIIRLSHSEKIGTRFLSMTTPRESRKRWLFSEHPQGVVQVDAGALKRIADEGASLLPVGVVGVEGGFERGAVVSVTSAEKKPVAVGVTSYSNEEIQKIKGQRSQLIEEILGYSYGNEVIHRESMASMKEK